MFKLMCYDIFGAMTTEFLEHLGRVAGMLVIMWKGRLNIIVLEN